MNFLEIAYFLDEKWYNLKNNRFGFLYNCVQYIRITFTKIRE